MYAIPHIYVFIDIQLRVLKWYTNVKIDEYFAVLKHSSTYYNREPRKTSCKTYIVKFVKEESQRSTLNQKAK